MAGIQNTRNSGEYFGHLQENGVFPVPQHAEPLLFQESRSRKVVFDAFRMLAAVQFDDESGLQADEIGEVRADAMLSPEFPATQAATAQLLPEHAFCLRLLAAQSMLSRVILFSAHREVLRDSKMTTAREAGNRWNCRICLGKCPSPAFGTLSPRRGERENRIAIREKPRPQPVGHPTRSPAMHDPRPERYLRSAVILGALAVLLVPAARGHSDLIGFLPLWLLGMPLAAWWSVAGFPLPRTTVALPRRRRAQARRVTMRMR